MKNDYEGKTFIFNLSDQFAKYHLLKKLTARYLGFRVVNFIKSDGRSKVPWSKWRKFSFFWMSGGKFHQIWTKIKGYIYPYENFRIGRFSYGCSCTMVVLLPAQRAMASASSDNQQQPTNNQSWFLVSSRRPGTRQRFRVCLGRPAGHSRNI